MAQEIINIQVGQVSIFFSRTYVYSISKSCTGGQSGWRGFLEDGTWRTWARLQWSMSQLRVNRFLSSLRVRICQAYVGNDPQQLVRVSTTTRPRALSDRFNRVWAPLPIVWSLFHRNQRGINCKIRPSERADRFRIGGAEQGQKITCPELRQILMILPRLC